MVYTWNGWLFLISLLLAGAFALAEIIKSKNQQAGELIEKIAPYQGYVGVGLIIFSLWNIYLMAGAMSEIIRALPVTAIVLLVALVVGLVLGLLDSLDVIKGRDLIKADTLTQIESKLTIVKIPLGIVAIATSIYLILAGIVKWSF